MTAYDIDGVLTAGIRPAPGEPHAVVSGRLHAEWPHTIEFVRALGVTGPVYLRPHGEPGDSAATGTWLGMMAGLLGCSRLVTDDPAAARVAKSLCPACEVIVPDSGPVVLPPPADIPESDPA